MSAGLSSRWERLFPERHFVFHGRNRVRGLRLGRATQIGGVAVIGAAAAAVVQLVTGNLASERLVAAIAVESLQTEMSNEDLRERAVRLQTRLDAVQGRLGAALSDADK